MNFNLGIVGKLAVVFDASIAGFFFGALKDLPPEASSL